MKNFVLFVTFICLKCVTANLNFYWRDFNGTIPFDAVPGGWDLEKKPTYIGSTYFPDVGVLPTTIWRGNNIAIGTAKMCEQSSHQNTLILCSKVPDNLRWVRVTKDNAHLQSNLNFIQGGYEIGKTLTIGRVQHKGQMVIGKLFPFAGLEIILNKEVVKGVHSFEILYSQDDPEIDVRSLFQ